MANKQKIWHRERVSQLIENVELYPCLWQVKNKDFFKQSKRFAALTQIAEVLQISSADEVKKKLHTLRSQFIKERTKMRSTKSGSAANEVYKTKWEFYEPLKFMFCHSTESNDTVDLLVSYL